MGLFPEIPALDLDIPERQTLPDRQIKPKSPTISEARVALRLAREPCGFFGKPLKVVAVAVFAKARMLDRPIAIFCQ